MEDTKEINNDNLQTVAQYAKTKRKLTREDVYYYIKVGKLKSVKIGGVIFIDKNEKIISKLKHNVKKTPTKTEKRIANSKKYLQNIKAVKIN